MKYSRLTLIPVLSFIFSSAPVAGQNIYKWTDAQGRVHFSNTPVNAADAVDEDLPPSTSFGNEADLSDPSAQPSIPAEQQAIPPAPTTTAAAPPLEEELEEDAEPSAAEEPTRAEDESTTGSEESPTETLPQTVADLSEQADEDESVTSPSKKGKDEDDEDSSDEDSEDGDEDEDEDDSAEESEDEG